jgi:hypothetical protein
MRGGQARQVEWLSVVGWQYFKVASHRGWPSAFVVVAPTSGRMGVRETGREKDIPADGLNLFGFHCLNLGGSGTCFIALLQCPRGVPSPRICRPCQPDPPPEGWKATAALHSACPSGKAGQNGPMRRHLTLFHSSGPACEPPTLTTGRSHRF